MFNEMKSEINSFLLNYFKNKGTFNKVIICIKIIGKI